jgi:hypothetical protein
MKIGKLPLVVLILSLWLTGSWVSTENIAIAQSSLAILAQRPPQPTSLKTLEAAYQTKESNIQVLQEGKVVKVLSDDNYGSRHQRFLLQLASGQTLLIAHNIDLSSALADLKVGDRVRFYGEYEWNSQGGVVHWTHRDPQRRHIDGWLEYKGKRYQ